MDFKTNEDPARKNENFLGSDQLAHFIEFNQIQTKINEFVKKLHNLTKTYIPRNHAEF